jgi:molybdopterin/thiamine biosynthesis adenylyltransferase
MDRLRETLLADVPLEAAHFLFARPVRTPSDAWRLIVCDSMNVSAADYLMRSEVSIEHSPNVVAAAMQRARIEGLSIIVTHSHPFAGSVSPSERDRAGETLLLSAFHRRVPDVPHARLIVGPDALHAAMFDPNGGEVPLSAIEVGADITIFSDDRGTRPSSANGAGVGPYDRQIRAFGAVGQKTLAAQRVAVIGLGGTGSVVVQQLAHLGVGEFLLIDPDVIEPTNLNRVVGATRDDVDHPKVDVARRLIASVNPTARVHVLKADVRDRATARAVLDTDVFVCCTDSQGSRAILSQLAYQYRLPGFDVGVAIHVGEAGVEHVSGRVQMLGPTLPCLLCCGVLDPETVRRDLLSDEARALDQYIVGAPTAQPAVISINSAASSLVVTMLLAAVTGVPVATRNQRLRLESGIVSRVEIQPRPDCPVCSKSGTSARGDSWPMPGRAH